MLKNRFRGLVGNRRWAGAVAACVVALLATTMLVSAPANAAGAGPGPVSTSPSTVMPHLPTSSRTTMQVRQLVPCGSKMYAVGRFTVIQRGSVVYTRNNAFSFDQTTGAVATFNPDVNGVVNSIALSADCRTAYLGGAFTSVHGVAAKNIAAVTTGFGYVRTGFARNAAGRIEALLVAGRHLLVGGYFHQGINGTPRSYMASLHLDTGRDDGYVHLGIAGNYQFTDEAGHKTGVNPTRVYNFELSPDRTRLLVMGDFTRVAGQARRQIFMLDLGATQTTLDRWYSHDFNRNCEVIRPFYVQAAAWSPDGATVYVGTTGTTVANGPGYHSTDPRAGVCDAAVAYSSGHSSTLAHKWVNYTGCDTLFSIAADTNDVYIGGHERWANNPNGCNTAGPGAVSRPGLGALSPTSGSVTSWNPTRGRGLGADDMVLTSAGLWIASDNFEGTNQCGGVSGLAGICFLPY